MNTEMTDSERIENVVKIFRALNLAQVREQLDHDIWANPGRFKEVVSFVLAAWDRKNTIGQ